MGSQPPWQRITIGSIGLAIVILIPFIAITYQRYLAKQAQFQEICVNIIVSEPDEPLEMELECTKVLEVQPP